jgi:hypothetical protein
MSVTFTNNNQAILDDVYPIPHVEGRFQVVLDGMDVESFYYDTLKEAVEGVARLTVRAWECMGTDGVIRTISIVVDDGADEEEEAE